MENHVDGNTLHSKAASNENSTNGRQDKLKKGDLTDNAEEWIVLPMAARGAFQKFNDLEKRKTMYKKQKTCYPDFEPVICQPLSFNSTSSGKPLVLLLPTTAKMYHVRKAILDCSFSDALPFVTIILFIGEKADTLCTDSSLVGLVHSQYKSEDGYLYVYYQEQMAFG